MKISNVEVKINVAVCYDSDHKNLKNCLICKFLPKASKDLMLNENEIWIKSNVSKIKEDYVIVDADGKEWRVCPKETFLHTEPDTPRIIQLLEQAVQHRIIY